VREGLRELPAIEESDDQLALCAEVCDHTADCCRQLAI